MDRISFIRWVYFFLHIYVIINLIAICIQRFDGREFFELLVFVNMSSEVNSISTEILIYSYSDSKYQSLQQIYSMVRN
jgi:uncharacterized membrane protein